MDRLVRRDAPSGRLGLCCIGVSVLPTIREAKVVAAREEPRKAGLVNFGVTSVEADICSKRRPHQCPAPMSLRYGVHTPCNCDTSMCPAFIDTKCGTLLLHSSGLFLDNRC